MANPTSFKPGQSGNPAGRPKGSRNALSERFLSDLCEHFGRNGMVAIERTCQERPDIYLRVVASLLPKQSERLPNPLSEFTDDELDQLRAYLESVASKDTGGDDPSGAGTPTA